MKLSYYLFQRLQQCGADYTFGIPGDFALPLYNDQAEFGLKTVVCAHEPGCVYAADAYSRLKGLGAVLTTYGVGGLNMINPVAMAYAEHSPVVVISGAPALAGRLENPFFHHLVKDYASQQRVFTEVTCATTVLTRPENAAEEIDRVLETCLNLKRPGYIEIPIDMTSVEIQVPDTPAKCITAPLVNHVALQEAAGEILTAFEKAKRPVLYAGIGVRRYRLVEPVIELAESWGIPVVSSVMGKASFPESHPNHAGVYIGKMGDKQALDLLENADLVLAIGVIFSDLNSGFWTSEISTEKLIEMKDLEVKISYHSYQAVPMSSLIPHLASLRPKEKQLPALSKSFDEATVNPDSSALTTKELIRILRQLDQTKYCYLADVGDALFAGIELETDYFMAPGYYASMGFAVPGAVGAALAAPKLRPIVMVGDGAFQMTGNELSTLVAHNLNPIIFVFNNGYYKMLSALDKHRDYYNLNNWDYVQYAEALGCAGERVQTSNELSEAIATALSRNEAYLIEMILAKDDHAPIMKRIKEYVHMKSS
jgi:indolepyruvate decarboxylase